MENKDQMAQAQPAGAPTVSLIEAARAFVQYAEDCDEDCIQLDNLKAALAAQPAGAGAPSDDEKRIIGKRISRIRGELLNASISNHRIKIGTSDAAFLVDVLDGRQGAAPAQAEPVAELDDGDREKLVSAILKLDELSTGTIQALGSDHLLKPGGPKKATMADVKRILPYVVSGIRSVVLKLDGATAPAHAGVAQADIERVANDLESEAIPYEGDFADSVRGAIEDLRTLAERTAVQTTDGATERRAANSHQQKRYIFANPHERSPTE